MQLSNKVIIVTGGANGIGQHYCIDLVNRGARVLIADLDLRAANSLAKKLNGTRASCAAACAVDVTQPEQVDDMVGTAVGAFGRIDVLINNAGVYPHVEFEHITQEEWSRVMKVNLDAVFHCSRAVLDHFRPQKSGKIINVTTDLVWVGLAGMVHYVASKAGVVGFTRALAREVGEYGVSVNALAPGPVIPDGEITEQGRARMNQIIQAQSLKRALVPADLCGPLVFLASSESDFITGQVLTVDGGLTNH